MWKLLAIVSGLILTRKEIKMFKKLITSYYTKKYLTTGIQLGDGLSYSYMGEFVGYIQMKEKFSKLENKIISLGLTPISLNDFINYGGYGFSFDSKLKPYTNINQAQAIVEENKMIFQEAEAMMKINLAQEIMK